MASSKFFCSKLFVYLLFTGQSVIVSFCNNVLATEFLLPALPSLMINVLMKWN